MDDEAEIGHQAPNGSAEPDLDSWDEYGEQDDRDGMFDWPEVDRQLPGRKSGWEHKITVPSNLSATLGPMLREPGLILLSRFAEDDSIVRNWLRDCLDEAGLEFETFLSCDFDSDDEVPGFDLCTRFCDLRDREIGRQDGQSHGRWLALAIGPRLTGTLADYQVVQRELNLRQITVICLVDPKVSKRLPLAGLRHLRVDTLEYAWRHTIVKLVQSMDETEYDAHLDRVRKVLAEKGSQIKKICVDTEGQDGLRQGLQAALAKGQALQPAQVCARAIELAIDNGKDGEISIALQKYLGSTASDVAPGSFSSLAELKASQNQREESFSIAIFVLWLCCRAQPGRENRIVLAEYLDLLRRYLRLLAAMEEANLDDVRKLAQLEDRDIAYTVSQVKTPAKDLLETLDSNFSTVIGVIGANPVDEVDARYIGYSEQIVARLSELFSKQSPYVAHHMALFYTVLRPLRSPDRLQKRIGQMLFRYEAQRWGNLSDSAARDRIVQRLLNLISEGKREADKATAERVIELLGLPAEMATEQHLGLMRILQEVGYRRVISVKQVVELIAVWHAQETKEAVDPTRIDDLRRDFRRLVTTLFKRLLETDGGEYFMGLFKSLAAKHADLIDLGAIARLTLNRNDWREINILFKGVRSVRLAYARSEKRKAFLDLSNTPLKYATYRFVVEELSDEAKLATRPTAHQWIVASLGNWLLHSGIEALREADYVPSPHREFSTDPMMSRILAEPDGLKVLVETIMNERIKDYAQHLPVYAERLAVDHSGSRAEIAKRIADELGRLAFQSNCLWFKFADGETARNEGVMSGETDAKVQGETEGPSSVPIPSSSDGDHHGEGEESKADGTSDTDKQKESEPDLDGLSEEHGDMNDPEGIFVGSHFQMPQRYRVPRSRSEWDTFISVARLLPYRMLQEAHEMLRCSERAEDAARLASSLASRLTRKDRISIQNVVRQKKIHLSKHLKRLEVLRGTAKMRGEDEKEVARWVAFASRRLQQTASFENVL